MQRFMSEFREFASRGSVIDLAVGVIIGVAFGKIVDSAVNDLIMPVFAGLLGKPTSPGCSSRSPIRPPCHHPGRAQESRCAGDRLATFS
jgi:hypothetical protein